MEQKSNEKIRMTARVSEVQRERYILVGEKGEFGGRLKGNFYKEQKEVPVVGDYVDILWNSSGDSLIERIHERKSYLTRPDRSGHAEGYVKMLKEQAIVANFDYVFIVVSVNQNFNINRIARYISIVLQGGGKPVVVLSKTDLCENVEELKEKVKKISDAAMVVSVSALKGEGMDSLKPYLKAGNTIAFIGSSGVGKSTMLNVIAGKKIMKVSEIREADGRGRHTTTHRHLFTLENGVTIIDTPGMREIGVCDIDEGLENTFSDVAELVKQCRFGNCTHKTEPGCAIRQAIKSGELSEKRWELYRKLQSENEWAKSRKGKQKR